MLYIQKPPKNMRLPAVRQLRLIPHPELRRGVGVWGSERRRTTHGKMRGADV